MAIARPSQRQGTSPTPSATARQSGSASSSKPSAKRSDSQLDQFDDQGASKSPVGRARQDYEQWSDSDQPTDEEDNYSSSQVEDEEDDEYEDSQVKRSRKRTTASRASSEAANASSSIPFVVASRDGNAPSWTEQEDAVLLSCVRKHGRQWRAVAKSFAQTSKATPRSAGALLTRYKRLEFAAKDEQRRPKQGGQASSSMAYRGSAQSAVSRRSAAGSNSHQHSVNSDEGEDLRHATRSSTATAAPTSASSTSSGGFPFVPARTGQFIAWSQHEDDVLLRCVHKHGRNWADVERSFAAQAPTIARSIAALGSRYTKLLKASRHKPVTAKPTQAVPTKRQNQTASVSASPLREPSRSSRAARGGGRSAEDSFEGSVSDGDREGEGEERGGSCEGSLYEEESNGVDFQLNDEDQDMMGSRSQQVEAADEQGYDHAGAHSIAPQLLVQRQPTIPRGPPGLTSQKLSGSASSSSTSIVQDNNDSHSRSDEDDYDAIYTDSGFRFENVPPGSEISIFSPNHFKVRRLLNPTKANQAAPFSKQVRNQQRKQAAFVFRVLHDGSIEGTTMPPSTRTQNARVLADDDDDDDDDDDENGQVGTRKGRRSQVVGYETRFLAGDGFCVVFFASV